MPDATADPGEPQFAALALATDRVDRASECFGDFLLCQKLREREDARLGLKCCFAGHSIVLRLLSVHPGVRRCGSALTETPRIARHSGRPLLFAAAAPGFTSRISDRVNRLVFTINPHRSEEVGRRRGNC